MKRSLSFIVVASLLALAHGFPRVPHGDSDSSESAIPNTDTILVLPNNRFPMRPIFTDLSLLDDDNADDNADESLGFFGRNPFSVNPFKGFLTGMQNAMNKLTEQMAGSLSRIGGPVSWDKIPEGANTTSTTKVIDGHVVTINETTYNDKSDDGSSFFRFRIIDVKPQDDGNVPEDSGEVTDKPSTDNKPTESTKEATTPARSVETVEDTGNNEIPDTQVDTLKA
ncbi:icarapin-like [Diachasma alloeum]|uniref:icarapin-like n=1 Tax=Diachasma alloeum TaxID=454923 RepID=UPI0007381537|nr:icarapin-like [Diachasma alloeum]